MIGGLLAGHDQSGGALIEKNGRKYKQFYGMSSDTAMKKYHGSVADYRASEGKTIEIPYRGDATDTMQDILGGLRSACTYTGATLFIFQIQIFLSLIARSNIDQAGSMKLKELPKRATFIRTTMQTNEQYSALEVATS